MSRIANNPIIVPSSVDVSIVESMIIIKGDKGELSHNIHPLVKVEQTDNILKTTVNNNSKFANALSGTTRALIQNLVTGVTEGFERKLDIVGVGYRAAVEGKKLKLALGFSHDVLYPIPEDVVIACPKPTEITVTGIDRQRVGQVAAEIRHYRPPEPYKGKGVRFAGEYIFRKEGKKK
jgi:large subunit ribosomal protein L6